MQTDLVLPAPPATEDASITCNLMETPHVTVIPEAVCVTSEAEPMDTTEDTIECEDEEPDMEEDVAIEG